MLFLLACAGPVDPADSGETFIDDSGSTRPDGWPMPLPSCSLAAPGGPADVEDLDTLWAALPRIGSVEGWMEAVRTASDDGCPTFASETCDAYTGGCSNGTTTAEGTATMNACDDGFGWAWDGFSVVTAEWSLSLDGVLDVMEVGDTQETWNTVHAVVSGLDPSGEFTLSGERATDGYGETRSEQLVVGDLATCIDEVRTRDEGCPDEPSGWTVVQGTHVAVALWNGDCDGCADLYLDGAYAGEWCPGG